MKPLKLPEPSSLPNYDAIDPLDARYYDEQISQYLSERTRVAYQAYVEVALAKSLEKYKLCPPGVADEIEKAANKISIEAVSKEEKITKHDVKALVNCLKKEVSSKTKPYVHFGATSYDIVATALSLQIRCALNELVIPRLVDLEIGLLNLTKKYANTIQIGRTHGQHAVPITFGFALAEYVSRIGENILALQGLSANLKGKFSGAVGAYNALSLFIEDPRQFEKSVLGLLNIKPAPYSSQIIPADSYVRIIDELSISAGIMANLAHDMRHLQRSEISEVREMFDPKQIGSSTMAHKRNPWNFENVISMAKQVTAQIVNANLNLSSEHQRDLTDSASARFYGVSLALVASMSDRLHKVMNKLEVDEENMQLNLHKSGGAIASEPLYLLLEKYGHTSAHEVVKNLSHKALDESVPLYEIASNDQQIISYFEKFSSSEKKVLKEPEKYYIGQASTKAFEIYDQWRAKLNLSL